MYSDVCLSAKIRILKQITTIGPEETTKHMMFVLAQRYENQLTSRCERQAFNTSHLPATVILTGGGGEKRLPIRNIPAAAGCDCGGRRGTGRTAVSRRGACGYDPEGRLLRRERRPLRRKEAAKRKAEGGLRPRPRRCCVRPQAGRGRRGSARGRHFRAAGALKGVTFCRNG